MPDSAQLTDNAWVRQGAQDQEPWPMALQVV